MKTKTHFAFRVDIWDDTGDSIVEMPLVVDDFEVAEATYLAAVARWPAARITRRQARVAAAMRASRVSSC
jgi:hypothetical protein